MTIFIPLLNLHLSFFSIFFKNIPFYHFLINYLFLISRLFFSYFHHQFLFSCFRRETVLKNSTKTCCRLGTRLPSPGACVCAEIHLLRQAQGIGNMRRKKMTKGTNWKLKEYNTVKSDLIENLFTVFIVFLWDRENNFFSKEEDRYQKKKK